MRKRLKNHFIPHEGNDYKPHFVRERNLAGMALLVVAIFGLAFSIKSLVIKNPDLLSAVITAVMVDLTNTNRLAQHMSPLAPNSVLASAAQLKANDMAEKSYFAHTSPEGKTPWYWFKEGGYKFLYAGENLAVNFVDSNDVVQAWMESPGHRANILNDKFTEIGIAIASGQYNGRDTIYVVQLFAQPAPVSVQIAKELSPTPTPTTPTPPPLPENVQVLAESKMFIAVQNNDYVETSPTPSESALTSSVVDRIISTPRMLLETIYIVIGAIVLMGLILFVTLKPRRAHTKHIVYVVALLILIAMLLYFSSRYLFPQIIIE